MKQIMNYWKTMLKRAAVLGLAAMLLTNSFPVSASAQSGQDPLLQSTEGTNVSYIGSDGVSYTCESCTVLADGSTAWTGWYVAEGSLTIESRVTVTDDAHLILADGASLTIPRGINVGIGKSLTIYAQSTGSSMGMLTIQGVEFGNAGIGGDVWGNCGSVTINGGIVTVRGGTHGAGIGSGGEVGGIAGGEYESITINDGMITATSDSGAGIGAGHGGYGKSITINGGTVTATSSTGAGIGAGADAHLKGTISIYGGTVTATSSTGAGIGDATTDYYFSGKIILCLPNDGSSVWASTYHCKELIIPEGHAVKLKDDTTHTFYVNTLTKEEIDFADKTFVFCPYPLAVSNVEATTHVKASHELALEGMQVTLTMDKGYTGTPAVSYTVDDQTHQVDMTKVNDTTYTFNMPAYPVTISSVWSYDIDDVFTTDENGVYTVPEGGATFDGITLTRDTTIVLTEGNTLTVNGIETQDGYRDAISGDNYDLTIRGTGKLVLTGADNGFVGSYGTNCKNVTIEDGIIEDKSPLGMVAKECLTVSGGKINGMVGGILYSITGRTIVTGGEINGSVHGISEDGITISGGQINASAIINLDILEEKDYPITLGCSSAEDFIYAEWYAGSTITIAEGQTLCDEAGNTYSGELTEKQIEDITKKKLRRAYTIDIDANIENGTVTADRAFVAANADDKTVTLTITPVEGYVLDSLSVKQGYNDVETTRGTGENANQYTFTMPAGDVTVTAEWRERQTVTLSATAEAGNITISPSGTLREGDTVTLKAKAVPGYHFDGWYEGDAKVCDTLVYSFTINADRTLVAKYTARGVASVSISTNNHAEYTINGSSTSQAGGLVTVPLGTTLTLTAVDDERFLQWENDKKKIIGRGKTLSIVVTEDMSILLVYKASASDSNAFVQFVSDYGQVLAAQIYGTNDRITFPIAPTKFGYTFVRWVFEGTETEATEEAIQGKISEESAITVKPYYSKNAEAFTVTVQYKGVKRDDDVYADKSIGTGFTVKAPEIDGYVFQHWKRDEKIVGYDGSYFMQVAEDVTLTAVYGTESVEAVPVISVTELKAETVEGIDKVIGISTRNVPADYTVLEHGMLYGKDLGNLTTDSFVIGAEGVKCYKSSDLSNNGVFNMTVRVSSKDLVVYFRAYMKLVDNRTGHEVIYYSDIRSGSYSENIQ